MAARRQWCLVRPLRDIIGEYLEIDSTDFEQDTLFEVECFVPRWQVDNWSATFRLACEEGDLLYAKGLSIGFISRKTHEVTTKFPLRRACESGHLHPAQCWACESGHLQFAQRLVERFNLTVQDARKGANHADCRANGHLERLSGLWIGSNSQEKTSE